MEQGLINIIERLGSLGLLGWLLVWATGTAWPKVSSHLDVVSAKLDRIGDQLTGLREDINELQHSVGADSGGAAIRGRQRSAGKNARATGLALGSKA